ncbi:cytochrome c [Marivita sp. XM-24bin2]|jgi:hypothetical protein|uniref:c-type cytochrome n=1 Tax=unclassified Marivita TaxID=2632480 RepID=UPI0025DA637E|nr:cytochrome c [uncultured Marivita sp.]
MYTVPMASAFLAVSVAMAQDTDVGKTTYQRYCAICHGADGTGDNRLTEYIGANVPNLTILAASNEGRFTMLDVIHVVDGRTALRGHGAPMPVYGALFDQESRSGSRYGDILYTRGKLFSIACYLEAIQQYLLSLGHENACGCIYSTVSRPISASLRRR